MQTSWRRFQYSSYDDAFCRLSLLYQYECLCVIGAVYAVTATIIIAHRVSQAIPRQETLLTRPSHLATVHYTASLPWPSCLFMCPSRLSRRWVANSCLSSCLLPRWQVYFLCQGGYELNIWLVRVLLAAKHNDVRGKFRVDYTCVVIFVTCLIEYGKEIIVIFP